MGGYVIVINDQWLKYLKDMSYPSMLWYVWKVPDKS